MQPGLARLLEDGLTDQEVEDAFRSLARLSPEQADVLRQMERFYLGAAEELRDAGVTVVVASSSSDDIRRLMRAAHRLDWSPRWVINDSQPSFLTLTGAPRDQGINLVQISSRRAAGDPVPSLDRGCISLRNTMTDAPPFRYRTHTDAWNLISATCDYLDVVFAAISRAGPAVTRDSMVEALSTTRYETDAGALITFAPDDRGGSDRFRVLTADPDCVLNDWGCMRAFTDWF